jgi:general stress protein 26
VCAAAFLNGNLSLGGTPMEAEQKQKLTVLLAQEHVVVITTQGEDWPTATMQAFAETENLDIILIMLESAVKFQNLLKRPQVTLHVDTRDTGDVKTFQVIRASLQGLAHEVAKGSAEWDELKEIFLKKNPFEASFFKYDALRMVRISPKRVSYANGIGDSFKAEL